MIAWKMRVLGGLVVSAILALAALRAPSKLMVNQSCEPDGPVAKLKSAVQGRAFWERQLEHLDRDVAWHAAVPARRARLNSELDRLNSELDRRVTEFKEYREKLYAKYPDLRPSPAQRAAEELRDQADELEDAELSAWLEQKRVEIILWLQRCRPIVQARSSR